MSTETNKLLVRQFIATVINTGNLALLDHFVAPDIIDHNAGPDQAQGIVEYRQHLAGVRTTFPDFTLTIEAQAVTYQVHPADAPAGPQDRAF